MLEMVKNIDLAPKMFMVLFENSMQLFHGRRFQIQAMNEEVSNCGKMCDLLVFCLMRF